MSTSKFNLSLGLVAAAVLISASAPRANASEDAASCRPLSDKAFLDTIDKTDIRFGELEAMVPSEDSANPEPQNVTPLAVEHMFEGLESVKLAGITTKPLPGKKRHSVMLKTYELRRKVARMQLALRKGTLALAPEPGKKAVAAQMESFLDVSYKLVKHYDCQYAQRVARSAPKQQPLASTEDLFAKVHTAARRWYIGETQGICPADDEGLTSSGGAVCEAPNTSPMVATREDSALPEVPATSTSTDSSVLESSMDAGAGR